MFAFKPQASSPVEESGDGSKSCDTFYFSVTKHIVGGMDCNRLLLELERNLEWAKLSLKREVAK